MKCSFFLLPMIFMLNACQQGKQKYESVELTPRDSALHAAYDLSDPCMNTDFNTPYFELNDIDLADRPYTNTLTEVSLPELRDSNNVVLYNFRDSIIYHPHLIAKTGIVYLDIFRRTHDSVVLELAKAHADQLIGMGVEHDRSLLIPYTFNYKFNNRDWMMAPWYSAISQGRALSLFARLHELTAMPGYMEASEQVFHSFSRMKSSHEDWISCVDRHGNLWLEEYPFEQASHVFNGMIYAIQGIYDYYMISQSEQAARYIRASVNTINNNMQHMRDPGELSFYCLKYNVKNPAYHPKHVVLLENLYKMSGIKSIQQMADSIQADTPPRETLVPAKS